MTMRKKLLKGGAWLVFAQATILLLQIVSTLVLAWILSPTDFGLVAIGTTIVLLVNSMTNMQLGEALIVRANHDSNLVHVAFTLGLIRGAILSGLMVITANPIASFYDDQRLAPILLALSILPLLKSLLNPCKFLKERNLIFTYEVAISISQRIVAVLTTLAFAYFFKSYWALVVGLIAEQLWGTALSYVMIRYRPRLRLKGYRELLNFSIWLTLGQAVGTINVRIEALLIGKLLGMAPLGIYRLGNNLAQTPTEAIITPIGKVAYPGFTRAINEAGTDPDVKTIQRVYLRMQTLSTAFVLPFGVGFALVADPLVRLLLDPRWYDAIYIIQFLAAIFALQTLSSLSHPLAMAMNRTKLIFIRDTQMLAIRLPIILVCLYFWGIIGVVTARVVTGLIAMLINMIMVRHLIEIPLVRQLKVNFRALLSVSVMSVGVYCISMIFGEVDDRVTLIYRILLEIFLGLVIYFGTMMLSWHLMKRPIGPEAEIIDIFAKILVKMKA